MLSWVANAWRVPELRRRVLFTAAVLAIYRLGSWIPAPGVDQSALQSLFSGGGILSLQLLTVVVPTLERLQKEGVGGYAKINLFTRSPTVTLAAARGAGQALLF